MPSISLDQMYPCCPEYTPSMRASGCQTPGGAAGRDRGYALLLRRETERTVGPRRLEMLELARLLDPVDGQGGWSPVPTSMASNRRILGIKDRVCGHLWEFTDVLEEAPHFFTAIPRGHEVGINELHQFDPAKAVQRFRSSLNQCGALGSDGILFAVLEAEYQLRTGLFRFHWHGIASAGKLAALDSMRELRAYYSPRRAPDEPKLDVAYRLQIARDELYNLPDPLMYLIKGWFARWTNDDGSRGPHCRIPDEALAHALLWQNQYTLHDRTLLMGIRPNMNGFTPTNSTRMVGNQLA